MQDRSRWVLILGGAGAAVAAVALLLEHESRRQRRFVAEHGGGEGGPSGGVDKKAIKDAINHAVQYARGPLVLGPNGKQKDQGLSLEDLLPRKFFADSVSDDHPKAAGKHGFSWAKLFERASNLNFVMAVANRSLEIMLYPLDLLAGKKYIETEERAVAIEKKKRAQVGSTAQGSPSRATGGKTALKSSPHLEHALANSVRSIYYSSIADEALRFAKMKKEWHDPDFPPEPTSLCSSCMSSSPSSSSPFSNRLRSLPVSWQQLRHTNSIARRNNSGSAVHLVSDWGTWNAAEQQPVAGRGGGGGRGESWLFDRYVATAAVAALQDDPTLCDDLLHLDYIAQGICGVALHTKGQVAMHYIDTYMPTSASPPTRALFGGLPDGWPAAVEKAIAKKYGSYEAISGSAGTRLALAALCGTEVEDEDLRALRGGVGGGGGSDSLWRRLCSSAGQEMLVLAASRSVYDQEAATIKGIHRGCSYHVLAAIQVGSERLLKVACALVGTAAASSSPLASSREVKRYEERVQQQPHLQCENSFWMTYGALLASFDRVAFAQRRRAGGCQRRELLALFGSRRACLVPGLDKRRVFAQEAKEAEECGEKLIEEEIREKKRSDRFGKKAAKGQGKNKRLAV